MEYSDALTLRDYLAVLRRRAWIVVPVVVLMPAVLVLLALQHHQSYSATAQVLLSKGSQSVGGAPGAERAAKTEADLAGTPAVAAKAVAAAHVTGRTADDILRSSTVTVGSDADILSFRVTDSDASVARALATGYARAYVDYRRTLDTQALARARANVRRQIAQLPRQRRAKDRLGHAKDPFVKALVGKDRELQIQQALQPDAAVLVAPADRVTQAGPRPLRRGALGLGLGLMFGIVLAFLIEALDTRVRSAGELAQALRLPLLARLPRPSRQLRKQHRLIMLDDPHGAHAEAFRVLRTNLEFFNLEHAAHTVMVTSAGSTEGKSTTVANLAVAMARSGRRVIVVDLDLRRPSLDNFFGMPASPGLTDAVLGRVSLERALTAIPLAEPYAADDDQPPEWPDHAGTVGTLHALPAGSTVPNVGELVGSKRLADLLSQLREHADIVLIDGPPLLGAGDGITLAGRVDGLIVVARLNEVRRPVVEEVGRLLGNARAATIGYVVTGAEFDADYARSPSSSARALSEVGRS